MGSGTLGGIVYYWSLPVGTQTDGHGRGVRLLRLAYHVPVVTGLADDLHTNTG